MYILKKGNSVIATGATKENKKVCNQNRPHEMQYFQTKEEAETEIKSLGLSGWSVQKAASKASKKKGNEIADIAKIIAPFEVENKFLAAKGANCLKKDGNSYASVSIARANTCLFDTYNDALDAINDSGFKKWKIYYIDKGLVKEVSEKDGLEGALDNMELPVAAIEEAAVEDSVNCGEEAALDISSEKISSAITDIVDTARTPVPKGKIHIINNHQTCSSEIAEEIDDIVARLNYLIGNRKFYEKRLKDLELILIDFNHFFEFSELSEEAGFRAYYVLKCLLRMRRQLKDDLSRIDGLGKLCAVAEETQAEFNGISDRTYMPRFSNALFLNDDSGMLCSREKYNGRDEKLIERLFYSFKAGSSMEEIFSELKGEYADG